MHKTKKGKTMQVSKVNSNYNHKNNQQPAFKSAAEQSLFRKMVETPELIKAARDVYAQAKRQPLIAYFAKALEALRTAFEQKGFVIQDSNTEGFRFVKQIEGAEPEKIQISVSTGKTNALEYAERQSSPSIDGVTECRTISYKNYAEDDLILIKGSENKMNFDEMRFGNEGENTCVEQELNIQTGLFGKPYFNHPPD